MGGTRRRGQWERRVWLAGRGGGKAHGRAFLERGGAAGHCGKVADWAPMVGRAGMGPDPPVTGPSAEPAPPLALCGPAVGPRWAGRALAAAEVVTQGGPGRCGSSGTARSPQRVPGASQA